MRIVSSACITSCRKVATEFPLPSVLCLFPDEGFGEQLNDCSASSRSQYVIEKFIFLQTLMIDVYLGMCFDPFKLLSPSLKILLRFTSPSEPVCLGWNFSCSGGWATTVISRRRGIPSPPSR